MKKEGILLPHQRRRRRGHVTFVLFKISINELMKTKFEVKTDASFFSMASDLYVFFFFFWGKTFTSSSNLPLSLISASQPQYSSGEIHHHGLDLGVTVLGSDRIGVKNRAP